MPRKPTAHRPFRVLRARTRSEASPAATAARPDAKSVEDRPTFARAIAGDGTVPLAAGKRRAVLVEPAPAPLPAVRPAPDFRVLEEEDWVEGYRSDCGPNARRRLRGTCTATLDLHGHDTRSARTKLVAFLAAERARGRALVLVIVGKGKHSPGGRAVLREEVATWLSRPPMALHVLAFCTAPAALGGSGGVTVLLAPPAA